MKINTTTGYIKSTGFGVKIRKMLFAARKANFPQVPLEEVARFVGEINQKIFNKLQEMKVDRNDVIRINFSYEIKDNKLVLHEEDLEVLVFKPVSEKMQKIFDTEEERKIIERIINELNKYANNISQLSTEMSKLIEEIKRTYENQQS